MHAKTIRDLPAICFYANSIVNALYERWCKQQSHSKYPPPIINITKAKNAVRSKIEKSLVESFKLWIHEHLSQQSCNQDITSDIVARLNINNQPSALYKFQKFLVGLALFPESPRDEAMARLKWVNKVRNIMVHMGDIPSDKKFSFNQRTEITSSITSMLLAIAEYYFSKEIFSIDNYLVEQNYTDIREYFNTGVFRGKKVFDETYEEYIKRQEAEWVENGIYV